MRKGLFCVIICLLLCGCGAEPKQPVPETSAVPEVSTVPETTVVPETSTEAADWQTVFCESMQGIWVQVNSVQDLGDFPSFSFAFFDRDTLVTGVYPGGWDPAGKVTDVTRTGENRYAFTLYFPEQDYMGDHYEASSAECTAELTGVKSAASINGVFFSYAGPTLEDAIAEYSKK